MAWNLYDKKLGAYALKENQPTKEKALQEGKSLIRYWERHGQKDRYEPREV